MLELITVAAIVAVSGFVAGRRVARGVRRFAEPCGTGCGSCGGGCSSTPPASPVDRAPAATELVGIGRKPRAALSRW